LLIYRVFICQNNNKNKRALKNKRACSNGINIVKTRYKMGENTVFKSIS
jgi:hypothetical protein